MANIDGERLALVTYLSGVVSRKRGRPEEPVSEQRETTVSGGVPLDGPENDTEEIDTEESDGTAMDSARVEATSLKALTRRSLSRRELERTLRVGGADEAAVEAEVRRLEGVGLIDDMALAQNLVGTLQERKSLGRSAIAAELARRMVSPAAIEYGLDLIDTGDELARARQLAAKRAGQLRGLDRDVAVRRLSAYLARRGYGGSTVRSAVDAALPRSGNGSSVQFR